MVVSDPMISNIYRHLFAVYRKDMKHKKFHILSGLAGIKIAELTPNKNYTTEAMTSTKMYLFTVWGKIKK